MPLRSAVKCFLGQRAAAMFATFCVRVHHPGHDIDNARCPALRPASPFWPLRTHPLWPLNPHAPRIQTLYYMAKMLHASSQQGERCLRELYALACFPIVIVHFQVRTLFCMACTMCYA